MKTFPSDEYAPYFPVAPRRKTKTFALWLFSNATPVQNTSNRRTPSLVTPRSKGPHVCANHDRETRSSADAKLSPHSPGRRLLGLVRNPPYLVSRASTLFRRVVSGGGGEVRRCRDYIHPPAEYCRANSNSSPRLAPVIKTVDMPRFSSVCERSGRRLLWMSL